MSNRVKTMNISIEFVNEDNVNIVSYHGNKSINIENTDLLSIDSVVDYILNPKKLKSNSNNKINDTDVNSDLSEEELVKLLNDTEEKYEKETDKDKKIKLFRKLEKLRYGGTIPFGNTMEEVSDNIQKLRKQFFEIAKDSNMSCNNYEYNRIKKYYDDKINKMKKKIESFKEEFNEDEVYAIIKDEYISYNEKIAKVNKYRMNKKQKEKIMGIIRKSKTKYNEFKSLYKAENMRFNVRVQPHLINVAEGNTSTTIPVNSRNTEYIISVWKTCNIDDLNDININKNDAKSDKVIVCRIVSSNISSNNLGEIYAWVDKNNRIRLETHNMNSRYISKNHLNMDDITTGINKFKKAVYDAENN